jgi:hypothetical protein
MKKLITSFFVGILALVLFVGSASAVSSYFNGFETDTSGWFDDGVEITRVPSGTHSITSADGAYNAEVHAGAFTRWGDYESVFPTDGYLTQVDVYLDMNLADGTDKRFDFSSAINQPSGDHRRDFIFSLGTLPGESATNQWAVSVSNNSPGWPNNPDRNPAVITESGWYTLKSTFKNNGSGVLAVEMQVIKKSDSSVVGTWTLSDPTDVIGTTVGGNRYGWFVTSDFEFLAIDNSKKINIVPVIEPPTNKDDCKKDGWKTFNNPTFKNQGACVSYVVSNDHAGKRD